MINKELQKEFYEAKRSKMLPFIINDRVEVQNGPHKGKIAYVISISSIEPELSYLIEFEDGSGDFEISTNLIRLDT